MAEITSLRSEFFPPPLDGLNLVSPPSQIKLTEARQLDNYLVFDTGIRQIGAYAQNFSTGVSNPVTMIYVGRSSSTGSNIAITIANKRFYRLDSPSDTSETNISGAFVATNDYWNYCEFARKVFFFNSQDTPQYHDLGTGNVTATTFTGSGLTASALAQGCGYKNRLYMVDGGAPMTYWYGGVEAISGALTSVDLSYIFQIPSQLRCIFSFTMNPGNSNEDFLCFLSDAGELLMYSGSYPGSASWELVARVKFPRISNLLPSASTPRYYCLPFVKVSGDVYVNTVRGVIALSTVVNGQFKAKPYWTVSRNIKNQTDSPTTPALDSDNPFVFFLSTQTLATLGTVADVYALNYERGSWSKLPSVLDATAEGVTALAVYDGYLMVGSSNGKVYNIPLYSTASTGKTYTWKTPFIELNKGKQAHIQLIRVQATERGTSAAVKNTVAVSSGLIDAASPIYDTENTTATQNVTIKQEIHPPGIGEDVSFVFSRAGVTNEANEIHGFRAYFDDGGTY